MTSVHEHMNKTYCNAPSMHAMLATSQAHISETRSRGQQQQGNNDFTSHLTQQSRIHSHTGPPTLSHSFHLSQSSERNTLAQVEIPENRTVVESCHFSDCNATKYRSDHSKKEASFCRGRMGGKMYLYDDGAETPIRCRTGWLLHQD